MTPQLHHLVYQSFAVAPFSEADLEALLNQSRDWNSGHALTGVLLYSEAQGQGEIVQVLEGTEEEVRYIFNRISRDRRHAGVMKLSDGPIAQRNFSQWSMGFKAINPEAFSHLKGYINLARPDALAAASPQHDSALHSVLADFVTEEVIRF